MKMLFAIVAGIGALVGVIYGVGATLPRDHVVTMSATIPAQPDSVWAALQDVSEYPKWRTDVSKVDLVSQYPLSWREHTNQGSMTLAADPFTSNRYMIARILDDSLPYGGLWEYELAPDNAGGMQTHLTITERGFVTNPLYRFVSKFIIGHHRTMESFLKALGRRFNADVSPVRA